VQRIIQTKFMPMGLIASPDSSVVPQGGERMSSALALNLRKKVLGPRAIEPIARVLQFLYVPPVLIPMVMLIALAHVWLYFFHGLTSSIEDVLYQPGQVLIVLVVVLVSSVFHEFGHASALRYGGGRSRGMGAGLYLVYPVFYTDTTDSYRLGRWARVRTDLGGFYFHLIFVLGLIAYSLLTGQDSLLAVVVLIDLDILGECAPYVRFDGYWALADLTGIPDFFSLMGPFVRSLLPFAAGSSESKLPELKPWVKVVFIVYVVLTPLVLTLVGILVVIYVPSFVAVSWGALLEQGLAFVQAQSAGDLLGMAVSLVQGFSLAIPLLGEMYLVYVFGRRLMRALWLWSEPTLMRHLVAALCVAGIVGLVGFLWLPQLPLVGTAVLTQPVDGISCDQGEHSTEHIHAHLTIYVQGREVVVPQGIGIPPGGNCFYWLHTHLTDGVIHVEAPSRVNCTLGQFVDIWAQSTRTTVLTGDSFLGHPLAGHQLVIWISDNGQSAQRYFGSLRGVVLRNHELITVAYDSPQVRPVTSFDWQHSSAGGGVMQSAPVVP
jgi:hypothetical protein